MAWFPTQQYMIQNSEFYNYFRDVVAIIEQKYPVIGFSHIKTADNAFVGEIFFVNGVLFGSFFQNDFLSIPVPAAAAAIIQKIDEANLFHSEEEGSKAPTEETKNSKQKYYRLARNIAYRLSISAEKSPPDAIIRHVFDGMLVSLEFSPQDADALKHILQSLFPFEFPHELKGKKLEKFIEWVYLAVKDHN